MSSQVTIAIGVFVVTFALLQLPSILKNFRTRNYDFGQEETQGIGCIAKRGDKLVNETSSNSREIMEAGSAPRMRQGRGNAQDCCKYLLQMKARGPARYSSSEKRCYSYSFFPMKKSGMASSSLKDDDIIQYPYDENNESMITNDLNSEDIVMMSCGGPYQIPCPGGKKRCRDSSEGKKLREKEINIKPYGRIKKCMPE